MSEAEDGNIVLVGVLRSKRDLDLLLGEHWYRIPMKYAPLRGFEYLAFYQPSYAKATKGRPASGFKDDGKRIRYYARVLARDVALRRELVRDEPHHPRAGEPYTRIRVSRVWELPWPIENTTPRRVTFGFTTLARLLWAKNMLQLYGVVPTEKIMGEALREANIPVTKEYRVTISADSSPNVGEVPARRSLGAGGRRGIKKRYRLDFAIFCEHGKIAIECDNKKAHGGGAQRLRDRAKNKALKSAGWTVLRFPERDIVSETSRCTARVERAINRLGGTGT